MKRNFMIINLIGLELEQSSIKDKIANITLDI